MAHEVLDSESIHRLIEDYYQNQTKQHFEPGKTQIQYAQGIFDHNEIIAVLDSLLSGWLGLGNYNNKFEKKFSEFLNIKYSALVNSGSSANLLAITALKLPSQSQVITPAVTFPTTLNPILQNNLVPVFIDINPKTYNIDLNQIEQAITSKTKAIFIPHTLGNPNNMDQILELTQKHDLFLIEDTCDALGSKYNNQYLSTFGDLGTFSFYPAHHMTLGEGGALVTNNQDLLYEIKSLRDWGRACVCDTCTLTTTGICQRRFTESDIPDYDKRYTYINIGYNLKPLDLQAAFGLEQLKRLPDFIQKRKQNFTKIYNKLEEFEEYFILPKSEKKADPCWFAFPLTVRDEARFTRKQIINYLEKHKISTRLLFAGNILKQPAYRNIKHRIYGTLENSDRVMSSTFFFGVHPGLTNEMIEYILQVIEQFIKEAEK